MKEQFYGLAARLEKSLKGGETLLCNLSAERSDFVRFNKALGYDIVSATTATTGSPTKRTRSCARPAVSSRRT